jgi:hypothetical protein
MWVSRFQEDKLVIGLSCFILTRRFPAKDAAARKEDDRVDGSDTCDDFGGEETTEWSPTEEAVHSPERNVSEKSPSTDADVLPQSESNATESTMPAIGIESVESAGGNRSPTAVESESSALSAKIDTLLSVVNENIQSNNRKLDLMAYLVLNKGDDENDAVNVKKARTELSELCSAFTVKK